jgi:hypothetical protein
MEVIGRWVALKGAGTPNGLWQMGAESNSMLRISDVGLRAGQYSSGTANVAYPDPGSANDVVAGIPYHFLETTDGTTKKLYVNGQLLTSVAATNAIGSGTLRLPWDFANGRESNMYLAGTAIYHSTLSAAQVNAHFLAAFNPFTDNFASVVDGTSAMYMQLNSIDTTIWSTEGSEPGSMSHTGWMKFVAPATGLYKIATTGSDFDTLLALYTGTALNNLVLVASDDNSGGGTTSRIVANLSVGTTYYVQAGAQAAGTGGNLSFIFGLLAQDRLAAVAAEALTLSASASVNRQLAATSTEVITNSDNPVQRRLGAISIEVLTPSKFVFAGWGIPL